MSTVLKVWCCLLAGLSTVLGDDRTLNRPGCADVAFVNDVKYLSCPFVPCNATSGQDYSATSCQDYNDTSCQGYNASSAVELGGAVVWEWTEDHQRRVVSSANYTAVRAVSVNISNGDLHIEQVTESMRASSGSGTFSCSVQNAEGNSCGYGSRDVIIFKPEQSLFTPKNNIKKYDPEVPTIGEKRQQICLQGNTADTNGVNYFMVQDRRVDAVDFTSHFNPNNTNPDNFSNPICDTCGCIKDNYRNDPTVNKTMTRNLEETGYAAFIVAFISIKNTDKVNEKNLLCYGLRNEYIMVLEIKELLNKEPIDISMTVTSKPSYITPVMFQFSVEPSYKPIEKEVMLKLFRPDIIDVVPENNTVIICNATATGNSSASLLWEGGGRDEDSQNFDLPQIIFHESDTLVLVEDWTDVLVTNLTDIFVENLTEDFLHLLCLKTGHGVFNMPLKSVLGPGENDPAYYLHLHAALVICNASRTYHKTYTCFANGTSDPIHAVVTISFPFPNLALIVTVVLVGIAVLTVVSIIVIVCLSVKRYRSKRFGPLLMVSYRNLPPTRLNCTNLTFDLPGEESTGQQDLENSSMEFARENLQFIKVLGEGQFGQVWKAKAVGICPDDVNCSIVAVKMLKPNASQWDKQEMHSELELMQGMPPHLNIVNFLGMCSETDSEPLLILMEFAMHGSLKDYLKRLTQDRNNPARIERMKRLGQHSRAAASRPCLCPCHTVYNAGENVRERGAVVAGQQQGTVGHAVGQQRMVGQTAGHQQRTVGQTTAGQQGIVRQTVGQQQEIVGQTPGQPEGQAGEQQRLGLGGQAEAAARRSSNMGSLYQYDPAVVAHAARLMRLLDSEYHQHENRTDQDGGSDSHSQADSEDEDLCVCAYHSQVDGNYYNYRDDVDYYNHNHTHYNTGGGGAKGVVNIEEEGGAREIIETPPPSYENAVEEISCHCSLEDTSRCSSLEEGVENLYMNVPTGCIYCSEGTEEGGGEEGGEGTVCMCPELNVAAGKLSYFELLDFAHQIARGMEHLEKMKCVHRDLAARNVLIAEGFWLKIGDFGLSRTLAWKDYYRKVTPGKIPARWMAKESLEERFHTSKSDVWSYGVVLWEVLTYGELPYGRTPMACSIDTLAAYLSTGRRLPQPVACSSQMYELLLKCWDENPDKRPSFTQLADIFSTLLQKSPDHLNTSMEVAAVYPEVAALEAEVFSRMCPIFEPPENCENCSELYPLDSPLQSGVVGPLLRGAERRDSGLELAEQDGRQSVSPGAYVPPNEVKVPQHKVLKAVESGVSSDGSYLGLHDPTADTPQPNGPFSPVSGTSRNEATPTYTAESARNLKTGLSHNLTWQQPTSTRHSTQHSPRTNTTASHESMPTAIHSSAGRSHDLSQGSHDQSVTSQMWHETELIETTV